MGKKAFIEKMKQNKKKILIGVGILYGIGMVGTIIDGPVEAKETVGDKVVSEQAVDNKEKEEITEITYKDFMDATSGTNEYFDGIYYYVKDPSNGGMKKVSEAWEWTKNNYPNYYTDNETMEKALYYGLILERYSISDEIIKNVGIDLVQAVKYVYRGIETVNNEGTKSNLEQIKKGIEKATN